MSDTVKFKYGSLNKFNQIEKDDNTVYFISDGEGNNTIYKGSEPYGGGGTVELPTYIGVGNTTVTTDSVNNTVSISTPTLTAGSNITLSPDTVNNTITISADSGTDTGVGEWIETGTQYTPIEGGPTYTANEYAEIFNSYEDSISGALYAKRNEAAGDFSHTEGDHNGAYATCSHAEGWYNKSLGEASHTEGYGNETFGKYSHAEGYGNVAANDRVHTEGEQNVISGHNYVKERPDDFNPASYLKLVGVNNDGTLSYVWGTSGELWSDHKWYTYINNGNADYSHAEGLNNKISGSITSHAEGENNDITYWSARSHIEGYNNTITGNPSIQNGGSFETHAEGRDNYIKYSSRAHIEGYNNKIYNSDASHAEGENNIIGNSQNPTITAPYSHVGGSNCTVTAQQAFAHGDGVVVSGNKAFGIGDHTIASQSNQFVMGRYNTDVASNYTFIIGNGNDENNRSNAFKIDTDGKIYVGNNNGVDVSGLYVTSNDDTKVLTATYQNGVGTYSWQTASSGAECIIVTDTSTSLPNKVVIENNHEYRYLSLTNATGITISIETVDISKSFYSTVVLHNVTSTETLSNFVSVSQDSVLSNVIFLNEDFVDLSASDTVEMLFFTNGMANNVMCIAYGYHS